MLNAAINMASPVNRGHPLNRGLVSWWMRVPGISSGSRLTDLVTPGPSGNHGTLTNMDNADWVGSSRAGSWGALDFDGGNDFVLVPDSPSLSFPANSDFTFSIACKNRAIQSSSTKFLEKKDTGATFVIIDLSAAFSNKTARFRVRDSDNNSFTSVAGTTVLDDDEWHWLMGTKRGADMVIYVNGVEEGNGSGSFGSGDFLIGDVLIGKSVDNGARFTDGLLDEARIWNRALTANEALEAFLLSQQGHPGLLNRIPPRRFVVAAGALSIPVAMHNYYRQRQWAGA